MKSVIQQINTLTTQQLNDLTIKYYYQLLATNYLNKTTDWHERLILKKDNNRKRKVSFSFFSMIVG